jgi:hypothetical protein
VWQTLVVIAPPTKYKERGMKKVTRYAENSFGYDLMKECKNGEWVKYKDFVTLQNSGAVANEPPTANNSDEISALIVEMGRRHDEVIGFASLEASFIDKWVRKLRAMQQTLWQKF